MGRGKRATLNSKLHRVVLDADGILKPAILLLVEEAFEAGLQA